MPPNTVYVGRPSQWGNPFSVEKHGREAAVRYFRAFCTGEFVPEIAAEYRAAERALYGNGPATLMLGDHARLFLHGKNLACWCPIDQPCHADVLLEIANA